LLLVAALVMATAATTLVAVVPLYADAIAKAGFERTLGDADPFDRSATLSTRAQSAEVVAITTTATRLTDQRLPGSIRSLGFATSRDFRLDETRFGDAAIASIGTLVTDETLLNIVEGGFARATTDDHVAVALAVTAAEELGVGVGDRLVLDGRADGITNVEIVALVEPVDRFDDLWLERSDIRDGVRVVGGSRSYGPFLVDPDTFAGLDITTTVGWRATVDAGSVTPDDIVELRNAARRLDSALADGLAEFDIEVSSGLPQLLASTDTALESSGAVIAVILLQIVGLSLYGLALASSVLSGSRLVETSLLRSRGATARQVGVLAAAEALLVVVPAAIAGPFLAQVVVGLIEKWGPVAATGLDLDPTITTRAIVASLLVATISVAVITWPAVRSAQALSAAKSERIRASRPNVLQRTGADVVIATLAILGLWQLNQSSAATRDLTGRLGTDPIVVLAPTLGVIAASLITLRLISVFARTTQHLAATGDGLATALAGWELARQPGRTARTSVLVVLAVTIGTFATVQGASWDRSQRDQANATASADLVVRPDLRPAATVGAMVLANTLERTDGVNAVVPFDRPIATVSSELGNIATIAIDARTADDVLRLRSDVGPTRSVASLHQPVDLDAVPLGDVDGDLTMTAVVEGAGGDIDDDLQFVALIVDRFGTVHRLAAPAIPATSGTAVLAFPLTQTVGDGPSAIAGPISLLRVDVAAPIVNDVLGAETPKEPATFDIALTEVAVGSASIEIGSRDWNVPALPANNNTLLAGTASARSADGGLQIEFNTGLTTQRRARLLAQVATSLFDAGSTVEAPIVPALVTPLLLDALELSIGDIAVGRVGGASVAVRLDGTVPVVPFIVDEPLAMLVDWSTVSAARYLTTGRFDPPTEYALAVGGSDVAAVKRATLDEPVVAIGVVDRREIARRLADDPFAIGLFGSLGLALAGSLLVAVVGLILAAVVGARERRTAYSVLRAMGTPIRTLRRWLLLEVVPLVAVSALAGLIAGVLLARTVLDALTVTREGVPAIPEPRLVIPWFGVAGVVAVAMVAGVIVPLLTGRLLGRTNTADDLRIGDSA
jgi:hypothetical protein